MAITKWDEYYIHQIPDFFDKAGIDAFGSWERTYVCCHNADGTLNLHAGLGIWPNANVVEGAICVRYKDVQRNILVSRHLEADHANMEIGPLSIKVLEPLKRLSIDLGDNDYGIGCSLEFQARGVPWPRPRRPRAGAEVVTRAGYDQAARFTGSITFEGQQFNADGFFGGRDRTWGRGRPSGNLGSFGLADGIGIEFWMFAHFSNFCLLLHPFGNEAGTGAILYDDGAVFPIVDVRHRVEFVPKFRSYSKVELLLRVANSKDRHLTIKPISRECYLSGSGYSDRHGLDRGDFFVEGEKWDVSQPFDIGHRLFGINHRVAEFQLDGEPGVGFVENCFSSAETWKYRPTW